jgi:hypothetical protein
VVKFRQLAKDLLKQMENALGDYVKANGPVVSGDSIAEFRQYEEWEADSKVVLAHLLSTGVSKDAIWKRLTISTKDVKDILTEEFPLKGSGITKEIAAENKAIRSELQASTLALGAMKPKTPYLGFYKNA